MTLVNILVVIFSGKKIRLAEQRGHTDPVTGGLNGNGLEKAARKYLSGKGGSHAVILLELNNYRQLLNTFGTEKTDLVLKHLYKTLRNQLSNMEPVARIGGGTFCFLVKNRQESAIRARLIRISENANLFNQNQQIPYLLDLRYGVCIPKQGEASLAEIMEKITEMQERSKETVCFYQEEAGNPPSRNWEQIRQMDKSLTNGDFVVYLQPKIRLSDNRIVGAEALIRWRHPERGMLTPEMFIPILEEYHLIDLFDLYWFEQICRQMHAWIKAGKAPCPVSVNLSHVTVGRRNFLESYARIAEKYGIAPELIEFELGRILQQQNTTDLANVVNSIHDRGFRCALDNFGSNTVQLQLLRELDVDTIKLDHSLFSNENNNRRNRFVVEAVIKIASQMQIRTVAEGIDNASQAQYLKQVGCDLVQGYHYFHPMTIDEFGSTAYNKDELRYLEESSNSAQENVSAAPNASGNIVMFSLLQESDRLIFSSLFSPLLEGQLTLTNAMSVLRHSELIHENDRKDFFHLLERCQKENGWVENAIRFYTSKGRYEWLEVHLHKEHLPAAGETVIAGTLVNMSGWKNEVNRWKEKATRDALTGLYNREYFEHFASHSMEKDLLTTAAIIFVDIDDFKNVNDTLGHMVGDDVICWFAKRVLGTFRHTDIVARYGGDEFVVFVNGISRDDLSKRLQQLCDGFRYPYRNGDVEYPTSGSIGAAMFPEDGRSYLELLDRADSALYEAKRQGKNRFVLYHSGLESSAQQ